jgi:hypothetical protein
VENSVTEGFITNKGFSPTGYSRTGPGQYQLVLASPPPDQNCIVHVTDSGGSIVATSASVSGGTVFVLIQSPLLIAGLDTRFYITVTDNS